VQGPGLHPVFIPQSETNDIDPATQVFQDLLPPDQNEKQVAGHPATFDPKFMSKIDNFLATVGEPTADVSELPSFAEEDFLEAFLPNVASNSQPSSENIPSEVLSHGVAQEETSSGGSNVQEERMDIETTWHLDVSSPQPETSTFDLHGLLDDYIVPRPQPTVHGVAQKEAHTGVSHVEANVNVLAPQPEVFSNIFEPLDNCIVLSPQESFSSSLLTAVTPPFSIGVNTNGDPTHVAQQVSPIPTGPSKSQRASVIMQGPALAEKQPQYGKPMDTSEGNTVGDAPFVIQVTPIPVQISPAPSAPRGKKVPKTNPERCQAYRNRQKIKKEKDEQELRQLDLKNRALKAKEADLRDKIRKIKEAARRMGLGNYFN